MSATATVEAEPPRTKGVLVIFTGLMLVMLIAALDQTIVATALPTIVGDLGGLDHISWVVTAYLLASTVVTPVYGKLGDQYGRKVVLQFALVLFLIGSALCGLSQNLTELVAFRAVQGLGGGGLMVGAMAAIGDVVSPRERGRYQGLFGAVFGLASVVGPLLGGFLTGSSLGWRWIFYINLPIGVIAFAVLAATLPGKGERTQHQIDYLGAGLLAGALAGIVLVCTLGGVDYRWLSPTIIALSLLSLALVAGFVIAERRAAEPVLPPRLFSNRVFTVTSLVGLVVGFALFGSITYLPLFLQVVNGASPTGSGLQILPLMAGLLITSIGSGQIITRTGHYRPFPIAGTFVMVVGLFLLSLMDAGTTRLVASAYMFVLGLGLGLVMQVLVLAVQNAVSYSDLGVATSGATLFRSIGGSVGTAILGSLFSSHLSSNLVHRLAADPQTRSLPASKVHQLSQAIGNPASLKALPAPIHTIYIASFTDALNLVFEVAAAVAAIAFLLSWLLPERPLRETVTAASGIGESFAAPKPADSLAEMARALSVLIGQEGRRHLVEHIVERAGVDLSAAAAWLLARTYRGPQSSMEELCRQYDVSLDRGRHALSELLDRGMLVARTPSGGRADPDGSGPGGADGAVERRGVIDGDGAGEPTGSMEHGGVMQPPYAVTERGAEAAEKLIAERRATVDRLIGDWDAGAEQHADLAALLSRLADELGQRPAPEIVGR